MTALDYETIRYALADGVATITLDRPEVLNSLNARMRRELTAALAQASQEARAILLTGAGRAFCAGQDLGDARDVASVDLESLILEEYAPLVRAIAEAPVPVVAAVNGVAAGAGANLALAADLVLAGHSAQFLQAFARIGLIPDAGGSYLLPRLIGRARAMGLCLLAEPLDAGKAADWGLIWAAVPDAELDAAALAIARRLAAGPTVAFRLLKTAMRGAGPAETTLADQLALEARLQGEAGRSRDFQEGVAAFLEKRPPRFEGR